MKTETTQDTYITELNAQLNNLRKEYDLLKAFYNKSLLKIKELERLKKAAIINSSLEHLSENGDVIGVTVVNPEANYCQTCNTELQDGICDVCFPPKFS